MDKSSKRWDEQSVDVMQGLNKRDDVASKSRKERPIEKNDSCACACACTWEFAHEGIEA